MKPVTGAEEALNREQAKTLKTQITESKRNICDLKAKVKMFINFINKKILKTIFSKECGIGISNKRFGRRD